LLPTEDILTILQELNNLGFRLSPTAEATIEINPGTIDPERLDLYREAGINRFSLGVQTFDDLALKRMGREHSAEQSRKDIALLAKMDLDFSVDLLFGLPQQNLTDLEKDLLELQNFRPPHVSAYNLTVPSGHPMNANRSDDTEQAKMFELISDRLETAGIFRYELSNYAARGKEGRHNMLYWSDGEYWGLGVSAHSYLKIQRHPLGVRFWNSPSASIYSKQAQAPAEDFFFEHLPGNQMELLKFHEALTDFCHTQLRKVRGLDWRLLEKKFGSPARELVTSRFKNAESEGLCLATPSGFQLSSQGFNLANKSFLHFTFLPEDTAHLVAP
jgi:oxygen-independent coproporphyrinogen-3 oxidase